MGGCLWLGVGVSIVDIWKYDALIIADFQI